MNKKGFTLIELLAVILILAIIAAILSPIVSKIIDSAREQSDRRSAERYAKAAQEYYVESQLDFNKADRLGTNIIDELDLENENAKGTIVAYPDGTVEMAIIINSRCFTKTTTQDPKDIESSKDISNCVVNSTNVRVSSINSKNDSIDINVDNTNATGVTISSCKFGVARTDLNTNGTVSGNTCTLSPTISGERYYYEIEFSDGSKRSGTVQGGTGVSTVNSGSGYAGGVGGGDHGGGAGSGGSSYTPGVAAPVLEGEYGQTIYTGKYLAHAKFIFFNVTTGTKCTMTEWQNNSTNTPAYMSSGCLRFWAYMEDDLAYTAILDRNITGNYQFANNSSDGPLVAAPRLKAITSGWKGTETPKNYIYSTPAKMYSIPYEDEGYHARFITTNEIAHIVGNNSFNVATTTADNWFYLDGGTSVSTGATWQTQIATASEPSAYYWLYSFLTGGCSYGAYDCNVNLMCYGGCGAPGEYPCEGVKGFWTSDKVANNSNGDAWVVTYTGKLVNHRPTELYGSAEYDMKIGIRPVVTILKSALN